MEIINTRDDERYIVISKKTAHENVDIKEWITEQRNCYMLCDAVLKLDSVYYFCSRIIDAKFEEIEDKLNE